MVWFDLTDTLVCSTYSLQGLDKMEDAVTFYKNVLKYDSMHVEAIACIATNHFYSDQPEVALKFYRYVWYLLWQIRETFSVITSCDISCDLLSLVLLVQ